MTEENTIIESGTEIVEDSNHYIEAIKEMKQNTVSRSEYNKVVEENRNLLKSLVNGETIDAPTKKEEIDIDDLRDSLFNRENTNLEYAKKSLLLRKELMARGMEDPFVPVGHNVQTTEADRATAQKVAEALEHCIEYADGDSSVFTNELMRITKDTPSLMRQTRNGRR